MDRVEDLAKHPQLKKGLANQVAAEIAGRIRHEETRRVEVSTYRNHNSERTGAVTIEIKINGGA